MIKYRLEVVKQNLLSPSPRDLASFHFSIFYFSKKILLVFNIFFSSKLIYKTQSILSYFGFFVFKLIEASSE